jgi:hypothetical protein
MDVTLTFPDGSLVGPGELSQWLEEVEAEPDIPQEEKDVAKAIVARIRQLSN